MLLVSTLSARWQFHPDPVVVGPKKVAINVACLIGETEKSFDEGAMAKVELFRQEDGTYEWVHFHTEIWSSYFPFPQKYDTFNNPSIWYAEGTKQFRYKLSAYISVDGGPWIHQNDDYYLDGLNVYNPGPEEEPNSGN